MSTLEKPIHNYLNAYLDRVFGPDVGATGAETPAERHYSWSLATARTPVSYFVAAASRRYRVALQRRDAAATTWNTHPFTAVLIIPATHPFIQSKIVSS
jgi:hypothetical protein